METKAWIYRDKSEWLDGEWTHEPDKLQWTDEATGYPCLIVRGPVGALCGYVGVPPSHPFYGKQYGHDAVEEISVHGGLTFSDSCAKDEKEHGVCHIPDPGEPEDIWWFGFDCAHFMDYVPGVHANRELRRIKPSYAEYEYDSYRNVAYVQGEVASLAKQLKDVIDRQP